MKYIIIILVYIIIACKEIKNENKVYKFSLNQKNEYNNYDSNNNEYESYNSHLEILFHIYSKDIYKNKGWIILLNYSKDNINIFKHATINKENNLYIKQNDYNLFSDIIKVDQFEKPNFSFKEFSYMSEKHKKKESKKLKYVNDFPLIKFTFSQNGIINIYRPDSISDLDFYDLIQFLNRIIFQNKKKFFDIESKKRKKEYNHSEKIYLDDEKANSEFSFKDYIRKKFKSNKFSLRLFKRSYMGIKLVADITVINFENKTGIINLEIYTKILNKKKNKIFSRNITGSTEEIEDFLVNKLGGFLDQSLYFMSGVNEYLPKEKIEKIINFFIAIIKGVNIKTLFKQPIKALINLLLEYKNEILDNSDNIFNQIISLINKYFTQSKEFLVPFINKLFNSLFTNNEFIKNFNINAYIYYLIETNKIVINTISETYEKIKNSENTKAFIEGAKKTGEAIKDVSGKIIKNGIDTIKDISKSETVNNIKKSCDEATNYIGNKIKGFFS